MLARKLKITYDALANARLGGSEQLEARAMSQLEELGVEFSQPLLDEALVRAKSAAARMERDFVTMCLRMRRDGLSLEKQISALNRIKDVDKNG